jgi:ComF family protein
LLELLLDIIFPRRCPICSEIAKPRGELICKECRSKLYPIVEPKCFKCGKPIEEEEKELCFDCERKRHHYNKGFGLWIYKGDIKKSLADFKNHNKREYAKFYVEELFTKYGDELRNINPDALVPVPVHRYKKTKRGYNQADVLARELGNKLDIPVLSDLLLRDKYTLPQKNLNDKERLKNLNKAFSLSLEVKSKFSKELKKILVVDDIYTTGSTIEACTNVLLQNGIKEVYFICVCMGKGY